MPGGRVCAPRPHGLRFVPLPNRTGRQLSFICAADKRCLASWQCANQGCKYQAACRILKTNTSNFSPLLSITYNALFLVRRAILPEIAACRRRWVPKPVPASKLVSSFAACSDSGAYVPPITGATRTFPMSRFPGTADVIHTGGRHRIPYVPPAPVFVRCWPCPLAFALPSVFIRLDT